jgi:hypothetical protein
MDGRPVGVVWERKRGLGDVNKMGLTYALFLGLIADKRLGLDFVGNQNKKRENFGLRLKRERI